ncbi:hypothetical protein U9M48_041993 [Paspalum notatum var. saurae]|uniref:SIAH-type domain-containing protein n=1 Tax=Paspalum notatum var. saurae TaxID=547442 RepID=A0AAQ3URW3_PASNO
MTRGRGRGRKRKSPSDPVHVGGSGVLASAGVEKKGASSGSPPLCARRPRVRPKSTAAAAAAAPDLTVPDTDFLDCDICFLPLKPPIFQVSMRRWACGVLGVLRQAQGRRRVPRLRRRHARRGYRRCHAMERVVDSVRAPCPNAPYGCDAVPAYHAREDHLRECPHAPCHCPAGDAACGFVGSTAALLDHVAGAHSWRCETVSRISTSAILDEGFNLVVYADAEHDKRYLFLVKVVGHPFCRAVSVVCVRPRSAAAEKIRVELDYKTPTYRSDQSTSWHYLRTNFIVACSDLSGAHLPDHPNESYQLIVPKYVNEEDDLDLMMVRFSIDILSQ